MQFDMPTSDTGPEAELPDDLQMLAEQLGEDALHLSTLYPAKSPERWAQTAAAVSQEFESTDSELQSASDSRAVFASFGRTVRWAAVAASLLITAGLSFSFWPDAEEPPAPVPQPAVWEPVANQNRAATQPPQLQLNPAESFAVHSVSNDRKSNDLGRVQGSPEQEQATVSTGLFMTLSSSEQEALLDLIEDENLPQPSVSF